MEDPGAKVCDVEDRGVSFTDVSPFCDELEKFIKYIGNVRDLNYLTYEYPNALQNRLDANIHELEAMLAEVKDALVNAERLKIQRKSINREKIGVKKILKRMRDDEVREMECIISLYDKPMFTRWENVRTTQKPEVLEVMLTDIKGKQLALENLTILATRKLTQIQVFQPSNVGQTSNEKSSAETREKTVIPLPFPSFCAPLIPIPPPPPPLPPLPFHGPVSHLPKRSHTQRLSIQRRRRLERRDENPERRCVVNGPNLDHLSLIPLTLISDLPSNNLASDLYPTILSPPINSSHNVFAERGTPAGTAAENSSHNVTPFNNNNGTRGLATEFRSEMRTVLQALFGDLRSAPTLLVTESNSSDVAEPENTTNDTEIELYALKKSQ